MAFGDIFSHPGTEAGESGVDPRSAAALHLATEGARMVVTGGGEGGERVKTVAKFEPPELVQSGWMGV